MIGKHRSIIVWSSIKQTTIIRQKKKKSNDTRHGFTVVDRSHCTHLLYTLNAFKWSLLFKWILPPYGARIKYISHECTLQDYHSSYEMEFQVYIYIYIHTPGIKASLHLWLSFTDRLTDCTGPQYIAKVTRWRSEWNVIYRDLNDITGLEMKVLALAARTCYLPFLREMKVTRQIFLSDGNNRFSIFFFFLSLSRFFSGNNC